VTRLASSSKDWKRRPRAT